MLCGVAGFSIRLVKVAMLAMLAMHELQGSKLPTLEICDEQSSAAVVGFCSSCTGLYICMSPYIYAAGGEQRAVDCCGALAAVPHERSVLLVSDCLGSCKGKAAASSYQTIRQMIYK